MVASPGLAELLVAAWGHAGGVADTATLRADSALKKCVQSMFLILYDIWYYECMWYIIYDMVHDIWYGTWNMIWYMYMIYAMVRVHDMIWYDTHIYIYTRHVHMISYDIWFLICDTLWVCSWYRIMTCIVISVTLIKIHVCVHVFHIHIWYGFVWKLLVYPILWQFE